MENVTFEEVCGEEIHNGRVSYQYNQGRRHKRINGKDGVLIEVNLPEFTGTKRFMVANRMPPETPYAQLGLLLDEPDPEGRRIDARVWGVGGMLRGTFSGDSDSGRTIWVFHAINHEEQRYDNWVSELVFYWR